MEIPSPHSEKIVGPTEQFFGEPVQYIEQDLKVYSPLRAVPDVESEPKTTPDDQDAEPTLGSITPYDVAALGLEAFVAVCREEDPALFDQLVDGLDRRDRDEHLARVLSLLKKRQDLIASLYDEVPDVWAAATSQPEDPATVFPIELGAQRPTPKTAQRIVRTDYQNPASDATVTSLLPKIGTVENI